MMHLRPYQRDDCQRLDAVLEAGWRTDPDDENRRMNNPGWTLTDGEQPAACGGAIELWPGVAEIWLCIAPTTQRLTLARTLWRKRKTLINDYGFTRLQCLVRANFATGRNLALRFGFRVEGYLHAYFENGDDAILMAYFGR